MATASSPSSQPQLLLVEDEALVRMVVSEELAMIGFAVTEAPTIASALASLALHGAEFAAAIVDVGLPDGRGDEFALKLRAQWPSVAVLVVSGYDENSLRPRFGGDNRVGFLRKPYFTEELSKMLERFGVRGSNPLPTSF